MVVSATYKRSSERTTGTLEVSGAPPLETNSWWLCDPDTKHIEQNTGDDRFTKNQCYLRFLDILKDGTTGDSENEKKKKSKGNLTVAKGKLSVVDVKQIMTAGLPMYQIAGEQIGTSSWREQLDHLEHRMRELMKSRNQLRHDAATHVGKDCPLEPKLSSRYAFFEAGLSPEMFVDRPTMVMNVANTVIDPAKRAFSKQAEMYPSVKTPLILSKEFFALFGFPDFALEATALNTVGKFAYKITYKTHTITDATPHSFFEGNDQIHQFINANMLPGKVRISSVEIKQFLLFLKEMGDVLQVLIMMLWHHTNPNKQYIMATHDAVVFTLCMVLNLNCSLYHKHNLTFFDGKPYDRSTATARFNDVKAGIVDHNNKILSAVKTLKDTKREIFRNVFTSKGVRGGDYYAVLPDAFYQNILDDIGRIQQALLPLGVRAQDVVGIDAETDSLRRIYTIKYMFNRSVDTVDAIYLHPKYFYTHDGELDKALSLKFYVFQQANDHQKTLIDFMLSFTEPPQDIAVDVGKRSSRTAALLYVFGRHVDDVIPFRLNQEPAAKLPPAPKRPRTSLTSPEQDVKRRRTSKSRSVSRRTVSTRKRVRGGSNLLTALEFPSKAFIYPKCTPFFDRVTRLNGSPRITHKRTASRGGNTRFTMKTRHGGASNLVVDMYDELVQEVRSYITPPFRSFIHHIYNEVLYDFYFERHVVHGSELRTKVDNILRTLHAQRTLQEQLTDSNVESPMVTKTNNDHMQQLSANITKMSIEAPHQDNQNVRTPPSHTSNYKYETPIKSKRESPSEPMSQVAPDTQDIDGITNVFRRGNVIKGIAPLHLGRDVGGNA